MYGLTFITTKNTVDVWSIFVEQNITPFYIGACIFKTLAYCSCFFFLTRRFVIQCHLKPQSNLFVIQTLS